MNIMLITAIFIAALIIIALLSVYAYKLTRKVKLVQVEQQKKLAEMELQAEHVMDEVAQGINVLAKSYLNDDLSATEACLRIAHILEQLQLAEVSKLMYPAVFELAEKTQHIPILAQWKALSPKEQYAFDKQRIELEAEYEKSITAAMKNLVDYRRPKFESAA